MILIISTTQGSGFGAERVFCELLSAWYLSDMPLFVVAPKNSSVIKYACKNNIENIELPAKRDALFDNMKAFYSIRKQLPECQIVHAWSARAFELARLVRNVQVCSGTLHDHPCARYHGKLRQYIMRWSVSRFSALSCVSNAVKTACEKEKYKCRLITNYNGLCDKAVKKTKNRERIHLGFLGMNAKGKGLSIIEQWINQQHFKAVWHLYGNISQLNEGFANTLCNKFPENVILEGRKSPSEIFMNIDILVHTSTGFDSLPTVLIEAARSGIPALASDLGGSEEIVDDGVSGFLFSPDKPSDGLDKLIQLVESENLRTTLGKNARKIYEDKFKVERMVNSYYSFWNSLL